MSLSRKTTCGLLAAALVGSAVAVLAGPGSASAQPSVAPAAAVRPVSSGSGAAQVTLLTGDQVTVSAAGAVSVIPGAGRGAVQYTTHRGTDGHVYVIPFDALALVGAGSLDSALFDVTALAGYGYDSRRGDLPLIVKQSATARAAARSTLTKAGATVTRELSSVNGAAVRSKHGTATAFWNQVTTGSGMSRRLRPEIAGVWLDRPYRLNLDRTVPIVGAPTAWAAGYDGTGVTVAVLDTGIDTTHPDLAGKVIGAQNFTGEADGDLRGHGTHVASIIAGTGAASDGAYKGVAPGASLLNAKVCLATDECLGSSIIAGMEWAAQQGADVVNMSFSAPDSEGVDPLEEALNRLTAEHDTLFVASSGNTSSGALDYSVGSPGTADAALSVGAVDDAGVLAGFSNRGPRVGDSALKPDLTAPGVAVNAARSSTGSLGEPGQRYVSLNGTSMAAPHVAGAAAILAQHYPTWSPAQLKAALIGSAISMPDQSAFQQGAGRLYIARGYAQTVLADPPSVSLGRQAWPHGDDPVLSRTITYTNSSTGGVTLYLSLDTRGPDGAPAPAGMFALSVTSVGLPPGATAQVTLTATTSIECADGLYSGWIHAVGAMGGVRVTTPFGVERGDEEYRVTLTSINRNGAQDAMYITRLYALDPADPDYVVGFAAGPKTLVVKKGDYLVESLIFDTDAVGSRLSVMANPRLRVTTERSVTFDARTAGQANVGISDDPLQRPYAVDIAYQVVQGSNVAIAGGVVGTQEAGNRVYFGQSDPYQWESGYLGKVVVTLARPGPTGDFRNSPRSYHLASYYPGNMPSGWTRNFSTSGLARVDAMLARHVPGTTVAKGAVAYPAYGWLGLPVAQTLPFDPPFTHAEYYNSDSNLRWQPVCSDYFAATSLPVVLLEGGLNAYAAGSTVTQSWNQPVFGPAHGVAADPARWVTRRGNWISLGEIRMFGDGSGHPGWSPNGVSTGQLVLKRDGTVIATNTYPSLSDYGVEAPGGYATYRLEVSTQRGIPGVELLSPRVDTAWTFMSDTMGGTTPVRLPLWNVAFRPSLDASNTAPAGVRFAMPATVAVQPDSTAAGLRAVTVQYSTDDGATWVDATVTGSGLSRTVTVTHPSMTGFVSLRASASDYAGNAVQQTIIHAYRIAP